MSIKKGVLYVVATPIGNRLDISRRALDVLGAVGKIAAEDTRHSRSLLTSFGIGAALVSLHEHNESSVAKRLLKDLQAGESVALISDAGTPLISDPGYLLVRAAHAAGIPVVPVPGPSALICALCASGLATDRFVFEGFPPARRPARKARLTVLAGESRTLIFYESCHRILGLLEDLVDCLGPQREGVVARELTKVFETIRTGTLAQLHEFVAGERDQQKGEFVVLVAGAVAMRPQQVSQHAQNILHILLEELPVKQAAALTARITGEKRNLLYATALALSGDRSKDN